MPVMRAWARSERTARPCNIPVRCKSAANVAVPVTLARPSRRGEVNPGGLIRSVSPSATSGEPAPSRSTSAARSTAATIGAYPVQRQMLPSRCSMISSRDGDGLASRRALVIMMKPGVQKPHWNA